MAEMDKQTWRLVVGVAGMVGLVNASSCVGSQFAYFISPQNGKSVERENGTPPPLDTMTDIHMEIFMVPPHSSCVINPRRVAE